MFRRQQVAWRWGKQPQSPLGTRGRDDEAFEDRVVRAWMGVGGRYSQAFFLNREAWVWLEGQLYPLGPRPKLSAREDPGSPFLPHRTSKSSMAQVMFFLLMTCFGNVN